MSSSRGRQAEGLGGDAGVEHLPSGSLDLRQGGVSLAGQAGNVGDHRQSGGPVDGLGVEALAGDALLAMRSFSTGSSTTT